MPRRKHRDARRLTENQLRIEVESLLFEWNSEFQKVGRAFSGCFRSRVVCFVLCIPARRGGLILSSSVLLHSRSSSSSLTEISWAGGKTETSYRFVSSNEPTTKSLVLLL